MSTPVKRDQFKVSDAGIEHMPTGYGFTPHPGSPTSGTVRVGNHGNKLKTGEDYRPHEVEAMMDEMWREHLAGKK